MEPRHLRFRAFASTDQREVEALIRAGLAEHWGSVDESFNPDLRDIARSYASGVTLIAEYEDGLVGTGTIVPVDEHVAEIKRMSVHADCRRIGVGRAIADELVAIAERWGKSRVVLETSADWDAVVDFYLGCGFVLTHRHDGDFGLDAWFERTI